VDDADIRYSGGVKVLCAINEIEPWLEHNDVFVAIGDNQTRKRVSQRMEQIGAQLATLIHPSAVIADDVEIGYGSVVAANAVINCGSRIGKGVIINTAATVDHDNVIYDFTHISPGVHLAGTVQIGEMTWIGIGASVSNNVNVCRSCVVGAGAVVIKSIDRAGTYIGTPAVMRNGRSAEVEDSLFDTRGHS
jgi:sugar O-acyltransferase (sialic acid O-acetyltransferase NeuD family)